MEGDQLTIAQISDIHCGHARFDPDLMEHIVDEALDLAPDVVVVAGDLTSDGYAPEFLTRSTTGSAARRSGPTTTASS